MQRGIRHGQFPQEQRPAPRLRTYPTYTVVSDKLHAIALLGMTNTRVKDYLDLSVLLDREALDVNILASAIAATFARRGMAVPTEFPMGLSDAFATDPSRQSLRLAFLKKNGLAVVPFRDIVAKRRAALAPALAHGAVHRFSAAPHTSVARQAGQRPKVSDDRPNSAAGLESTHRRAGRQRRSRGIVSTNELHIRTGPPGSGSQHDPQSGGQGFLQGRDAERRAPLHQQSLRHPPSTCSAMGKQYSETGWGCPQRKTFT